MKRNIKSKLWLLLFFFSAFTPISFGQNVALPLDYNKTLLQISSGFYTVEKQASVDLDSSLLITSQWHKLSRVSVIAEGIDDDYTSKNCHWMDKRNCDGVKKTLAKVRGLEHARLSLLLGAYYAFYPGFNRVQIDSSIFYLMLAKKECDQLNLTKWSLHCSLLLGKCYFKANNVPEGIKWFKTVTDKTANNSGHQIAAKAWNYEGMYCPFLVTNNTFRIDCLNKALVIYEQINDKGNQINTLMNIAYLNFANRDIKGSELAANRSLTLQKSNHFMSYQYTYDLLAYFEIVKSDYPKVLNMGLEAVKYAEANKDSLALGHFYERVAASYLSLDNHEEYKKWQKKSLVEFERRGGDIDIYSFLGDEPIPDDPKECKDLITLVKATLKDYPPKNAVFQQFAYIALARCYDKLKENALAEQYFLLADNLQINNPLLKGGLPNFLLTYSIGEFYLKIKDYNKSKKYFSMLLSEPYITITPRNDLMLTYYQLHLIDSISGSYLTSLHYLNRYIELKDSLYNETESKQLANVNIKYNTEQKEKDLKLLKAQNELELQREKTIKRFTYAGFILLFFVIAMIYSRYYYNKKSNSKLKVQKDEIDQQNHALQNLNDKQKSLITEKEWLLKEIHHRVKNNLQTTMSLLNMQSAYISNDEALDAIKNSQRRMQAMSLIHQQLYQSEAIAYIDMALYIKQLVKYLKESFTGGGNISYNLQIEPLTFDVAQAVPLGLIINEAVTNSIKYAFPDNEKGIITIFLDRCEDGYCKLSVEDNGIGLSDSFNKSSGNTLGMNLMKGLTDQLQGEFCVKNNKGTLIVITFKISELLTVPVVSLVY